MKVFNKTKNIYLANNLKEAVSLSDKLLGKLKTSNIGGWMFKTRFGIHTFFIKEPIDVIVLDDNFKVVKLATVKPNNIFFWHPRFSKVLEFPQSTIKKTKTQIGDICSFDPKIV